LVRIRPSAVRITPDPSPSELDELDSTETTEGRIAAATCCTDPSAAGAGFADVLADDDDDDDDGDGDGSEFDAGAGAAVFTDDAHHPPPNPATSAATTVDAAINVVRPRPLDRPPLGPVGPLGPAGPTPPAAGGGAVGVLPAAPACGPQPGDCW
jgi:hypothetical protein